MTSQFITLKSGCRINVAHIVQYSAFLPDPEKLWIEVNSGVEGENEKLEDMTATELDALLSPHASPIVSPVIDLDRLKVGAGCCFTCEGTQRHGIISGVTSTGVVHILSSGDEYCYDPCIDESYPTRADFQ